MPGGVPPLENWDVGVLGRRKSKRNLEKMLKNCKSTGSVLYYVNLKKNGKKTQNKRCMSTESGVSVSPKLRENPNPYSGVANERQCVIRDYVRIFIKNQGATMFEMSDYARHRCSCDESVRIRTVDYSYLSNQLYKTRLRNALSHHDSVRFSSKYEV